MRLQDIVESVENWRTKTAQEVIAILRAPTVDHVETEWFTGYGLSLIIGEDAVQPFIDRIRATGKQWLADSIAYPGMPIGDPVFNQRLLDTGDVDAIAIARHGRRKISILEHHKSTATDEQIASVLESSKVLALREDGRRKISQRYNVCFAAYGLWSGDPATEPQL